VELILAGLMYSRKIGHNLATLEIKQRTSYMSS